MLMQQISPRVVHPPKGNLSEVNMNRFKATICAAIAATFAAGSALPVAAAPVFVPAAQSESNVVQVHFGDRDDRRLSRDRRDGRYERRDRRDRRDGRFEARNGRYYYNGHRGFRDRRAGYRYHNGYWFPAGAFIAGAIIGGAMNSAASASSGGSAHVNWCNDRYRTYRSSDNTFMSTAGYRKACNSPYN